MNNGEQRNKIRSRSRLFQAGALAVAILAVGWGTLSQGVHAAPEEGGKKQVASVGTLSVDRDELLKVAATQLDGVEVQKLQCETTANKSRYDVLSFTLEQLVRDRLAELGAQQNGLEKAAFIEKEGEARREVVTDAEIDRFIASNQRLARTPREKLAPQVRAFLAESSLYADLEKQFDVQRELEPYRINIDGANGVPKGGASASVEIVEFSDFQCPYCKQVNPALDEVLKKYDGQVKLVFRQFPLESIHSFAFKAAESALCAADQGKFWEMHDLMFEEQRTLSVDDLKDKAKRLGLRTAVFDACLDEDKHADQVREDLKEGALAGVSGTPALFINGRPFSGRRDVAGLSKVIDEELQAADR